MKSNNNISIRNICDLRFGVWYSFTNIYLFDMKLLSCKSKSDTTDIYLEIVPPLDQ